MYGSKRSNDEMYTLTKDFNTAKQEYDHAENLSRYNEITSLRDVTLGSFPQSPISFQFDIDSRTWWTPGLSYLKMRCLLKKDADNMLTLADGIAPAADMMAHLFQNMQFEIGGVVVSRLDQFIPQINTLEQRLGRSAAWLKTIGASLNFAGMSLDERMNAVSSDGVVSGLPERLNMHDLMQTDANGTDTGLVLFPVDVLTTATWIQAGTRLVIASTQVNLTLQADFEKQIRVGDQVILDRTGVLRTIYTVVVDPVAHTITLTLSRAGKPDAVLVKPDVYFVRQPRAARTGEFEICWQPPLSLFKIHHALPVGRYRLSMTPNTEQQYKPQVIQTRTQTPVPADYLFQVKQFSFMVHQTQAERMDENLTYYVGMQNTRCQSTEINTQSFSQKSFEVSPGTQALSVAFQDARVNTDAALSAGEFRLKTKAEGSLKHLKIQFASQEKPSFVDDPTSTPGIDYTTQLYYRTLTEAAGNNREGGGENLTLWQDRGIYFHYDWPRDGADTTNKVTVFTEFKSKIDPGTSTILLFDHYRSLVEVVLTQGAIASVRSDDF